MNAVPSRLWTTGAAIATVDFVADMPGPFGKPRTTLMDERGTALRLSWHPVEGVAVLSLWRDDRCIGTFRATPGDMAGVISHLSDSLASAVSPSGEHLSDTA